MFIKIWSPEDRITFLLFWREMYILTPFSILCLSSLALLSQILSEVYCTWDLEWLEVSQALSLHQTCLVLYPSLGIMAETADGSAWVGEGTLFISMLFLASCTPSTIAVLCCLCLFCYFNNKFSLWTSTDTSISEKSFPKKCDWWNFHYWISVVLFLIKWHKYSYNYMRTQILL